MTYHCVILTMRDISLFDSAEYTNTPAKGIIANLLTKAFVLFYWYITAQKMKFSIMDFFSKCDQIRSFLWIWSHLLKKSVMENSIFCAVHVVCIKLWFNCVIKEIHQGYWDLSLHKKWNFPLRISSANVTKSVVSCGFAHIYWRNA